MGVAGEGCFPTGLWAIGLADGLATGFVPGFTGGLAAGLVGAASALPPKRESAAAVRNLRRFKTISFTSTSITALQPRGQLSVSVHRVAE